MTSSSRFIKTRCLRSRYCSLQDTEKITCVCLLYICSCIMEDLYYRVLAKAFGIGGEYWLRQCLQVNDDDEDSVAAGAGAGISTLPGSGDCSSAMEVLSSGAVFPGSSMDVTAGATGSDPTGSGGGVGGGEKFVIRCRLGSRLRSARRLTSPAAASAIGSRTGGNRKRPKRADKKKDPVAAADKLGASGAVTSGRSPIVVWILGHSFTYWAHRRALYRIYTTNLGLSDMVTYWAGVRGLRWEQLMDLFEGVCRVWPSPDIIIIHAGGNDIGRKCSDILFGDLKMTFRVLAVLYPTTVLCFSEIVPRLVWSFSGFVYLDTIRRRLNKGMSNFMSNFPSRLISS
ncbi:uncharacterized protein [Dendropsophus ebraccatus]|uniref:uncharacterized protein isoform X2 n=1 Tax=Dendropsophus ebraccatus TaxID=150705 RepID=UPI003831F54C